MNRIDSEGDRIESAGEDHREEVWEDHREEVCEVSDQQKAWERGDIDFMHKDRFTVIRHYLDNSMGEMTNKVWSFQIVHSIRQ